MKQDRSRSTSLLYSRGQAVSREEFDLKVDMVEFLHIHSSYRLDVQKTAFTAKTILGGSKWGFDSPDLKRIL